jgi:alkylation response protein AidB-like acyl-CoA dehydrogenase
VDLQLTDEQRWLAESVDELLARADAESMWRDLGEFGAFEVGDDGLGAVELALIARGLGARLAPLPYADAAAVQYAVDLGGAAVVPCLAEPGRPYMPTEPATAIVDGRVTGEKDAVPHAVVAEMFAVPAAREGEEVVLAIVNAARTVVEPQPTLDSTLAPARVRFDDVQPDWIAGDAETIHTVAAAAAVLVSAEAVGAAGSLLELAREYATQRRQFGRPISGFQALRHILADMYVQLESAWSSVLYAAASLDEQELDAGRTAAIAKAYTARATQEVAHGALQVFGGIAFTAEHPAHRHLRRIVVRGGSYGAARDHERAVARSIVGAA